MVGALFLRAGPDTAHPLGWERVPGWPHSALNMAQLEGGLCPRVRWGLQNLPSCFPAKDGKSRWSQGSFVGPQPPHLCCHTPLLCQHGGLLAS